MIMSSFVLVIFTGMQDRFDLLLELFVLMEVVTVLKILWVD